MRKIVIADKKIFEAVACNFRDVAIRLPFTGLWGDRGCFGLPRTKLDVASGGSQIETCKSNPWIKVSSRDPSMFKLVGERNRL